MGEIDLDMSLGMDMGPMDDDDDYMMGSMPEFSQDMGLDEAERIKKLEDDDDLKDKPENRNDEKKKDKKSSKFLSLPGNGKIVRKSRRRGKKAVKFKDAKATELTNAEMRESQKNTKGLLIARSDRESNIFHKIHIFPKRRHIEKYLEKSLTRGLGPLLKKCFTERFSNYLAQKMKEQKAKK
eukprot:UN23861